MQNSIQTGKKIKAIRKSKKLTQKQLGDKLNVSEAMISQYERGLRNAKLETLQKIASALDVSVSDISGEVIQYFNYDDESCRETADDLFRKQLQEIGCHLDLLAESNITKGITEFFFYGNYENQDFRLSWDDFQAMENDVQAYLKFKLLEYIKRFSK